jgi:hypothetical protein
METKGTLPYLVRQLQTCFVKKNVPSDLIWKAIAGAMEPQKLISNLAEVLRISEPEVEELLMDNGFGDLVGQIKLFSQDTNSEETLEEYKISSSGHDDWPFQDLLSVTFSPSLDKPLKINASQKQGISLILSNLLKSVKEDPFLALYRKEIKEYYEDFMAHDAKKIDEFISEQFKGGYPRYIVNSGIGANEQFNHLVAHLNNQNHDRACTWLVIDSPRQLVKLPSDATIENTVFMEFSRSGKTEETVKIHEYTPRKAKRIVFANSGPLRLLGERDGNLLMQLPDQVSGRFGRNKTPILLAPMLVAKMDTQLYWDTIENAVEQFDLSSPHSLPVQIAQFLYLYQKKNEINHIYFGCNDDALIYSADEFLQFWNEGVNKNGNDISMSRYFGLLRDSHLNIEGILSNHKTKMGFFLFREKMRPATLPPMTSEEIDPINPKHQHLKFGDEEVKLAEANFQRFSELMPCIKMMVKGDLKLEHAAVLGQLWSDITFFYSRMIGVDPGSNPEVKYVRDRAAALLEK